MKTLQDIEAGDEVAVMHRYRETRILRVARVTKTQIITENGDRWRRSNGYMVGDRNYRRSWIEVAADRHRIEVQHRRLATKIDSILYRLGGTVQLSLATLRTIAEALEADPAVKEGW